MTMPPLAWLLVLVFPSIVNTYSSSSASSSTIPTCSAVDRFPGKSKITTSPGFRFVRLRQFLAFLAAFMNSAQDAVRVGNSASASARSKIHMTNIMHQGCPSSLYHFPYLVRLLSAGDSR